MSQWLNRVLGCYLQPVGPVVPHPLCNVDTKYPMRHQVSHEIHSSFTSFPSFYTHMPNTFNWVCQLALLKTNVFERTGKFCHIDLFRSSVFCVCSQKLESLQPALWGKQTPPSGLIRAEINIRNIWIWLFSNFRQANLELSEILKCSCLRFVSIS